MSAFVDLNRRFRDLTDLQLADEDTLAASIGSGAGDGVGWQEFLKVERVLLLAEAGSGKTREMEEQVKAINSRGEFAVFVPIESLCREPLANCSSRYHQSSLSAWKEHGSSHGWFFLDSVDEMKLTNGKLQTALARLANELDGRLSRASIILSSRPSDWRPETDMSTFLSILPVACRSEAPKVSGPEEFLRPVARADKIGGREQHNSRSDSLITAKVFALQPLTRLQIKAFALSRGVASPEGLLAEIERRDAWDFANRPLDLSDLIDTWKRCGRIGTRAQQHAGNIATRLKDDLDRPDSNILNSEEALHGAERLSLALSLCRLRTILVPELSIEAERSTAGLDPSLVLPEWTESKQRSLLRRAIFDPATYGRVRFHHRSIQEYLAAKCLKRLRDAGMATASVFGLLFADKYHTAVVIPSMRPIAAWLALWDNDVRNELMKREPEVLLTLGDPESLPVPVRAKLLRTFSEMYGEGGWRGIGIPVSEVRRLSCPDLAPTVRELWGSGPQNDDVRTLLLEVIWCGPMAVCMDIAENVAKNVDLPGRDRLIAVHALLACGQTQVVRSIAESLIAEPTSWSDRHLHTLAALIFPEVLALNELMLLVERTPEPDRTVGGFGWELLQISESLEPISPLALNLRNRLADLIWLGREPAKDFTNIAGRYDHLAPALARLCHRQIAGQSAIVDDGLVGACVIASRFGGNRRRVNEALGHLKTAVRGLTARREALFWADLSIMDSLLPGRDDWDRLFHTFHDGLLDGLIADDMPWIEAALANRNQPTRRGVAFQAWVSAWQQRGCALDELPQLHALISDDPKLTAIASGLAIPVKPNPAYEKLALENELQRLEYAEAEAAREAEWHRWRDGLVADPNSSFSVENEETTLWNMYGWLKIKGQGYNKYNAWDGDLVEREFGEEIAQRVIQAGRNYWRRTRPLAQTERAPDQWNTTLGTWIFGLACISAEASIPGWTENLTPEEARTAAAYTMVELNGFAPIINDLSAAFPNAVDEVVGTELSAQLKLANTQRFLPVLQNLEQAATGVQKLLTPRLLAALPDLDVSPDSEAAQNAPYHLDSVLRILTLVSDERQLEQISGLCASRFEADSFGYLALTWLRGLFAIDACRGTELVASVLSKMPDAVYAERAIAILVALFGDRGSACFSLLDPETRAKTLGKLIRIAYATIRYEDDEHHEGVFTPNRRDNAESARQFLLGLLIQTPGPQAGTILSELASEPDFAHFPDRLRMFARQRAASDSEPPSFTAPQVVHLVRNCEVPPYDRDGLFTVMMTRLGDLAHNIAHGDFTDRATLQTISSEEEMQRTLAWRLEAMAKGVYGVSREDEVADKKRVDIRLRCTDGGQKAVIEIKIADNGWTLADFERALSAQLVGQYLRNNDCKAGCLLLAYGGRKRLWERPITAERLNFFQVIEHLRETARRLESAEMFGVRLGVFGLDLTPPVLAPAHG
jgi:hypothetical protein